LENFVEFLKKNRIIKTKTKNVKSQKIEIEIEIPRKIQLKYTVPEK
jgi:hypothetical protein